MKQPQNPYFPADFPAQVLFSYKRAFNNFNSYQFFSDFVLSNYLGITLDFSETPSSQGPNYSVVF